MNYKSIFAVALCAGVINLSERSGLGQTTAIWTGPASGGEWNAPANWSTALPPGADVNGTTNAFIGAGTNVSYNLPMTAAGFGALTNNGTLNINTNGFNCSGIFDLVPGGGEKLYMNTGAVVTVNAFTLGTNNNATLSASASLTVNGALTLAANESSHASGSSILTNNGGYLSAQSTTINNNTGTGTGLLLINGGTNYLGNTAVGRNNSGAGGTTLGTEGLVINNGLVIMTNLNLGNAGNGASSLSAYITGGTVTNFGSVFINQGTSTRFSRLLQKGGLFVVPDPGVVNPNPTVSGSLNNYTVFGGTNFVGGFYFGNSNGSPGTVDFTNGAVIYVGSQGIASNGVIVLNAFLFSGGLFGATSDWTNSTTMKLNSGTFAFQTADPNGVAHNITLVNPLTGIGNLNITGNGALTLSATNTYSGITTVSSGTLALGASGALASPEIVVGSGAVFDVSQTGGFVLNGGQTLAGFGTVTGAVMVAANAIVDPGSNALTGTLTFSNSVTETGFAINHFDLASAPGPNNDFVFVAGDLDISGTNTIEISGGGSGNTYPLIQYGGNFNGDLTNFVVTVAVGALSNSPLTKTIYFTALNTVRGPTNTVWVGNTVNNSWDLTVSTNWLNAGKLDYFVTGDNVRFDNTGGSNSMVNIVGDLFPGSVTVDTTSNYTFTGSGLIDGPATLTKTNSSILTILTTNNYSGATTISGGTLEAVLIAGSLTPSSIGSASTDPSLLVLTNGGTLRYIGGTSTATDRGLTLASGGGAIAVTNGSTLTINGTVNGAGLLTKTDNGELVLNNGNANSGGVAIGSGTLTLANAGGAGSGVITMNNGTTLKISGALTVGNQVSVPAGTVTVDMDNAGGNTALDGAWSGAGTVILTNMENNTRTFTIGGNGSGGGSMTGFSGTIECGTTPGSVRFNDGGGNGNTGSTNLTLDLGSSTATFLVRNGGVTINIGALLGSSTTSLSGRGSGSSGTVTYSIGGLNSNPEFDGTIKDGGNATAITKVGTGTSVLSGQNTYTGNTVINGGTLALVFNPTNNADGAIGSSATINIASGTVLDVSGRSDGTLQLGASALQTLEGRGTLRGSLSAAGSATVAPGGGMGGNTGTLTVTNSVALTGVAWMKLNRTNSPNSDQLDSSLSTITYGGTLIVTNIGGRLQVGDTFTLFTGGGLSGGSFSTIALPNYYTWNTSNLGINGTISVTAILPPPAITNVDSTLLSSGTLTLNAANGAPNGPVVVLTSTNMALPLSSWTSIATNAFDPNGNLSLPITVDGTLPESFYLLQAN